MEAPVETPEPAGEPSLPSGPARPPRPALLVRLGRALTGPAAIAIVTWLVATPVAVLVPRVIDFDPFLVRGAFVPLAAGGALLVAATAAAWWRRAGERVAACAAGLFAAWLALALQVSLNGTPFGFSGHVGDMGRMAAAANRYTVTPWPSDTFIEGIPSEYPPLYPWLIGRSALVLGVPAWQALAVAEILVTSFAVLAAFLMWRRMVPAAVALVISGAGLLVFGYPQKAFSAITLFVFVPWLIASFTSPPRGRLHWLPAGVIGGLIMLTYNGWYPFGVFGILAILVAGWRRADDRKRYVWHVLGVGVVALVVSAPYLVTYGYAVLTRGGEAVGDLFLSGEIPDNGFPFLAPTLLGALQLVGLAGAIWYRQRTWWAWPLLYLVLGSYAFWLIMGVRFVLNGHTTLIQYVPWLTGITLTSAGVLTLVRAAPALVRRLDATPPYRVGAAAAAVAMLWIGFTYWHDGRPRPELATAEFSVDRGIYATMAHLEPLPDCTYPRYAPPDGRFGCLPADEIRTAVERVRGTGDRPHTLSGDERLFAYLPWRGYMGTDRTSASSLARWDDRRAELARLSKITEPGEFARESASTEFGPIDVFVLGRGAEDSWTAVGLTFTREQFDPAVWSIADDLSQPVVVATRRP